MNLQFIDWKEWITPDRLEAAIRTGFLLLVILPVVFLVARWARSWASRRFTAQRGLVIGKLVRYTGISIVVILVFRELGFSIAPLLGAAGIAGVALAFASQTSVSNIISGLFLIAENPFSVGDLITVNGLKGVVLSIDTLSVKLRTLDNRFVRIPNETLIKSECVNITKFPVRRIDINLGVDYSTDLKKLRSVLMEVADANPLCLMEPKPLLVLNGFGESSIDFLFGVWVTKENYLKLKNSIQEQLKEAFDREGIEIPFPQRVVYFSGGDSPGKGEAEHPDSQESGS